VPVAFVRLGPALAGQAPEAIESLVKAACKKLLADFKIPREVHIVEDFPRVSVGKISKPQLRAILKAIP
jgi:crotonobetaine/carnitine-CoA ligase